MLRDVALTDWAGLGRVCDLSHARPASGLARNHVWLSQISVHGAASDLLRGLDVLLASVDAGLVASNAEQARTGEGL